MCIRDSYRRVESEVWSAANRRGDVVKRVRNSERRIAHLRGIAFYRCLILKFRLLVAMETAPYESERFFL